MAWAPFSVGDKVGVNPAAIHSRDLVDLDDAKIYTVTHLETDSKVEGGWRVRVDTDKPEEKARSCNWFVPITLEQTQEAT